MSPCRWRRLAEFEAAVRQVVAEATPRARLVLFGHVGDGNLHVNVVGPDPDDEKVDDAVLQLVADMEGSISAEHGIGRAKNRWLHLSRSAERAGRHAIHQVGPGPRRPAQPGRSRPEPLIGSAHG